MTRAGNTITKAVIWRDDQDYGAWCLTLTYADSPDEPLDNFLAVAEAQQNHWKSWTAFMDKCPPEFGKFKINVPIDEYKMTATTVTRDTMMQRAKVLGKAWTLRVKGEI